MSDALLMLEDGTAFRGESCGVEGEVFGAVCFNTAVLGYPEIISDPGYAGHLLAMTYPQVGNYGIARADLERDKLALRGLIVRDICYEPSNFRSDLSLPDLLQEQRIIAISQIDTRALTRHIREKGTLRAGISSVDLDEQSLLHKVQAAPLLSTERFMQDLSVKESCLYRFDSEAHAFVDKEALEPKQKVVVYDCGAKNSILQGLVRAGCEVELVPWNTPASEVLAQEPQGVCFSNGPGNAELLTDTVLACREILGRVPLMGIGLGHQLVGLALGGKLTQLQSGHHGSNQPVMDLSTHTIEACSENRDFTLEFESLGALVPELSKGESAHPSSLQFWIDGRTAPVVQSAEYGRVRLAQVNLNDATVEGLCCLDVPAFTVQYHPAVSIDPAEEQSPYTVFVRLMKGQEVWGTQSGLASEREAQA